MAGGRALGIPRRPRPPGGPGGREEGQRWPAHSGRDMRAVMEEIIRVEVWGRWRPGGGGRQSGTEFA